MLKENKLLALISILGTALAICLIMVMVITYQVRVENYSPEDNRDRTMYVRWGGRTYKGEQYGNGYLSLRTVKACFLPLKTPEAVSFISPCRSLLASLPGGKEKKDCLMMFTDDVFWKVFNFEFISGSPYTKEEVSSGIKKVVISESTARRLYGTADAAGKTIMIAYKPYTVGGVVKDISTIAKAAYAEAWIPYTASAADLSDDSWAENITGWFQVIILARSASDFESIRTEIKQAVSRYNAAGREFVLGMNFVFSRLDLALGSNDMNGGIRKGWKEYLTKTAPLLLFLLLVPTLNLTGVVQSSVQKRRSEMGLRKAFGATKGRLLVQVLCENLIITLIGGLIGIVLSVVMLQLGKSFLLTKETAVTFEMLFKPVLFAAALFFTLLLNLLSAGLPAIRIAREQIVDALNNK